MPMFSLLLTAAVACGCAVALTASGPDAPGQARIDIVRGETTAVTALFDGATAETLTYRLEVVREGSGGRSHSTQGGAFDSAPGRADTLSTVRVSTVPGDHFEARLTVQRGDVTVSEDYIEETVR